MSSDEEDNANLITSQTKSSLGTTNGHNSRISSGILRTLLPSNALSTKYARLRADDDDQSGDNPAASARVLNRRTQGLEAKSEFNVAGRNDGCELRERTHSPQKTGRPKFVPYFDDEKKAKRPRTDHIIREIEPGDTLQNLSLKCGCTVSELKRTNNLMTEQDFYGLKYIKIPVKRYGLLTEVLVHQTNTSNQIINDSNESSPPDFLTGDIDFELTPVDDNSGSLDKSPEKKSGSAFVVNVGLKQTFNSDGDPTDVKQFIRNLDKDLEEIRKVTTNYTNTSEFANSPLDDLEQVPKTKRKFY